MAGPCYLVHLGGPVIYRSLQPQPIYFNMPDFPQSTAGCQSCWPNQVGVHVHLNMCSQMHCEVKVFVRQRVLPALLNLPQCVPDPCRICDITFTIVRAILCIATCRRPVLASQALPCARSFFHVTLSWPQVCLCVRLGQVFQSLGCGPVHFIYPNQQLRIPMPEDDYFGGWVGWFPIQRECCRTHGFATMRK